jgi:DNA mismatch endonuclease (patch repair protein)
VTRYPEEVSRVRVKPGGSKVRPPSSAPSFKGLRPASPAASRAKKATRKRDTRPEVLLRRALWAAGVRYRTYAADLPGSPDIVIRRRRLVIFCDGDFWHGRDWPALREKLLRRHNADYWVSKIARNRERDREQNDRLTREGWLVLRFWESEILSDPDAVAETILKVMASRSCGGQPTRIRDGGSCLHPPASSPSPGDLRNLGTSLPGP